MQLVTVGDNIDLDQIKVILGKGYDPRQPEPIRYPSVRQHFINSRQNFWLPSEIPMGDDKQQWGSSELTDTERWLFKCNISYLTASDNLVPDIISESLLGMDLITNNETRQYLRWQVSEECNHIESYFFILESLGLDEEGRGKIFGIYNELEPLRNKLNWNIQICNELTQSGIPATSPDIVWPAVRNMIAHYVFEYLFFPTGFAQVFALARNGKFKRTAEQYRYIWRDEVNHAINDRWLILQVLKENPKLKPHDFNKQVTEMVEEAVDLEVAYAGATMPDGGISGFSLLSYVEFVKFMADNLLKTLGISPIYKIKEHPLPWMSEFELNSEANFFEKRVKDYRINSGLDFDSPITL